MPVVSRWMIRLSLIYLIAAIVLGGAMLIHKAYPLHPAMWALLPVHIEFAMFGWIIQLTLGTAYWILPRYLEGPSRGSSKLANVMAIVFNIGLWLVIAGSLLSDSTGLRAAGRVLEVAAVGMFIKLHWNRIVTYNK